MQPGESLEARTGLVWSPHCGQRLFLEGTVRLEELLRDDLAVLDGDDRALGQLALAELDRGVALDELERDSRRGYLSSHTFKPSGSIRLRGRARAYP